MTLTPAINHKRRQPSSLWLWFPRNLAQWLVRAPQVLIGLFGSGLPVHLRLRFWALFSSYLKENIFRYGSQQIHPYTLKAIPISQIRSSERTLNLEKGSSSVQILDVSWVRVLAVACTCVSLGKSPLSRVFSSLLVWGWSKWSYRILENKKKCIKLKNY